MANERLRILLEQVQAGHLPVSAALQQLQQATLEDLQFALLDHQRAWRCGFPEVIYGPGKTVDQLVAIVQRFVAANQGCLATRLSAEQQTALQQHYPASAIDELAQLFWWPAQTNAKANHNQTDNIQTITAEEVASDETTSGLVLVLAAGTADLPVAREAELTARAFGGPVELVVDVGVAGLHRLLHHLDRLLRASAIVVVAGMEGALPTVVAGLVACPVFAVPTSVGYGTNFHGLTALLSMLNSCTANVAVVNIDAGFRAGYLAGMIARQTHRADPTP